MKKVPLETAVINDDLTITYREQILQALTMPENPQAGTDAGEMARVLPIMEKLEGTKVDYLLLEDSEHEELAKRMKATKFTMNHPALKAMVDAIVDAPDTEVKAVG